MKDEKKEFDEIVEVTQFLRNKCSQIKSAKKAIDFISKETGIDRERVKQIVIKIGEMKDE